RRDQSDTGSRVSDTRDPRIHFFSGQLTTFTRFRALRDLDLQLLRIHEIVTGNSESSGSNLLDGAVARIAVTLRIFATLAGVALTADAIHRYRDRLVRFLANRAVRHRAGFETLDDCFRGLDFVN